MVESSSFVYPYPRLYRERMNGGARVFFDYAPNATSYDDGGVSGSWIVSTKRPTITNTADPTNMSVSNDEYGPYLQSDGATGSLSLGMSASVLVNNLDVGDFGDCQSAFASLSSKINLTVDNNANQYPIYNGTASTNGWYMRRHSTADYYAHVTVGAAGSLFTYSDFPGAWITNTPAHWVSIFGMEENSCDMFKDLADLTNVGTSQRPYDASVPIRTCFSADTHMKMYRVMIMDGPMTHEERSMFDSGFM